MKTEDLKKTEEEHYSFLGSVEEELKQ